MINVDEYKMNPCRLSAIPYWKAITFRIPNNISVIHNDQYNCNQSNSSIDTLYFRLKHNLRSLELIPLDNKLLFNLSNSVDFVTVSRKVDNKTNPEKLYRRCGFEGKDIWHIVERRL